MNFQKNNYTNSIDFKIKMVFLFNNFIKCLKYLFSINCIKNKKIYGFDINII